MKSVVCVLVAALSLAACASAPPPEPPLHPYKVVLLPIVGAKDALSEKPTEASVPFALTPEALDTRIRDSVQKSRVFSEVIVATAADLRIRGVDDEMQAAAQIARNTASDLILRIEVKSARMADLGNNSSTFWSTVTWFMLGIPSFWVDDRTYDTNLAVQAELYDPADPVKPTASVVASSGKQDLDLWDRGLTPLVIIVPPAFLEGSDTSVSETLTDRAMAQLLAALVDELRTREIPSRFEMDVKQEGAAVAVSVTSRRRLRSLEVEADGKALQTWAETGLVADPGSGPDRYVYRRTVQIAAKPRTQVRVIAEDEGGGREVRTLVIGDGR